MWLAGLVAAYLADDAAPDLGVAVRVLAIPDRDGDVRVLLHRLVLGPMHLGVDQQLVVGRVHPHDVAGELTAREVEAEHAEVRRGGEVTDRGFEFSGHPDKVGESA